MIQHWIKGIIYAERYGNRIAVHTFSNKTALRNDHILYFLTHTKKSFMESKGGLNPQKIVC